MNIITSKGWHSTGDMIWSDTQGPYLVGLDFIPFEFDNEDFPLNYICVGYRKSGQNVWFVKTDEETWELCLDIAKMGSRKVILKKLPTKSEKTLVFVEKAWAKHGKENFCYSKVQMKFLTKEVKIICKIHGIFRIKPRLHLLGRKCLECEQMAKMEQRRDDFIVKSTEKHQGKYTYEKVKPLDVKDKAEITCPDHGSFFQNIHSHMSGRGCSLCPKTDFRVTDLKGFILRSNQTHNFKFDYSKAIYINKDVPIEIICSIHGSFWQKPSVHRKSGCPACWKERRANAKRKPFETFLKEAREMFGLQYDYSKTKYISAHKKIIIICPKHGEFEQSPNNHIRGCGCSKCGRRGQFNTKDYISLARELRGSFYDYSKVLYEASDKDIIIICPNHGEFSQRATAHLQGQNCPKCAKVHRRTREEFIKEASLVHKNKYQYPDCIFVNLDSEINVICPDHGEYKQKAVYHLRGSGCLKCAGKYRRTTEEFRNECSKIHKGRYDYSKTQFTVVNELITIICPDHGEFDQIAINHLSGCGCPKCGKKAAGNATRSNSKEFREKAKITHGELYDYSLVDYISSKDKVLIICHLHGSFLQTPSAHLRGSGCPTCRSSRGEKEISIILKSYQIPYESEKKFVDCVNVGHLRFDFYVEKLNLLIEYDGIQHFKPVERFGGEEALLETQYRDSIKTKFAGDNGYTLLRIRYDEDIKEKLLPFLE